jgi:hypothetical protein
MSKIDFTNDEFAKFVITVQEKMVKENLETYTFIYENQSYKAVKQIRQVYEFKLSEIEPQPHPERSCETCGVNGCFNRIGCFIDGDFKHWKPKQQEGEG